MRRTRLLIGQKAACNLAPGGKESGHKKSSHQSHPCLHGVGARRRGSLGISGRYKNEQSRAKPRLSATASGAELLEELLDEPLAFVALFFQRVARSNIR